ncbi:hypothetical protein BGX31_001482, partial [Mortierella sp. GBA43]
MEIHQSPHGDRDLPLSGADQNSPPRTTVPSTVKPNRVSFADAAKAGLPVTVAPTKKQQRAAWSETRTDKEARPWQESDTPDVIFARPMEGYIVGIKYDKKTQLVNKVVRAVIDTFPKALQLDHYRPGVIFLQFNTEEESALALKTEIPFSPSPLTPKSVVYSTGRRIHIRADHFQIMGVASRTAAIEKLFGPYGKVVHTTFHYWQGSEILMPSLEFVLEVPRTAPRDLHLPRVAEIMGSSHLFTWAGSAFCYKCGKGDHVKQ